MVIQLVNRGQSFNRNLSIPRRIQKPLLQLTAAHAGHAGVKQREKGGRIFAAQGLREFEIAPRTGGQINEVIGLLHFELRHVGQRSALRVFSVSQ